MSRSFTTRGNPAFGCSCNRLGYRGSRQSCQQRAGSPRQLRREPPPRTHAGYPECYFRLLIFRQVFFSVPVTLLQIAFQLVLDPVSLGIRIVGYSSELFLHLPFYFVQFSGYLFFVHLSKPPSIGPSPSEMVALFPPAKPGAGTQAPAPA